MEGVTELAEEVFHLPVSLGRPRDLNGLDGILQNPAYATCSGLLSYASRRMQEGRSQNHQKRNAMQKAVHTVGAWMRKTYDSI